MTRRLLLLAALLASACAQLPSSWPEAPQAGGETLELLDYYERLAGLPVEQQSVEYLAARGVFELEPSDANRVRLALTLSLPQAPWRDDDRVIGLLEPFEQTPREMAAPLRAVALLIRSAAAEQLRLREDRGRRDAALRDEQRRNAELQRKLEALRAIERDRRRPPVRR